MEFAKYQIVPPQVAEELMEQARRNKAAGL